MASRFLQREMEKDLKKKQGTDLAKQEKERQAKGLRTASADPYSAESGGTVSRTTTSNKSQNAKERLEQLNKLQAGPGDVLAPLVKNSQLGRMTEEQLDQIAQRRYDVRKTYLQEQAKKEAQENWRKNNTGASGLVQTIQDALAGTPVPSPTRMLVDSPYAVELQKHMAPELEQQKKESVQRMADWADRTDFGGLASVVSPASVASVGTSLLSGVDYLGDLMQMAALGETLPSGAPGGSEVTRALREGVSRDMSDVGKFLYNTAMSGADSLAAGTLGSLGGGIVLGLGAASAAADDVRARGGTDAQAMASGLFSGVAEGLFEKLSIGQMKALKDLPVTGIKSILRNLGNSAVVNASEETLTELANILWDSGFMGDISNYAMAAEYYEQTEGLSPEEAKRKALLDLVGQIGEAALSGGLMGLGFGGLQSGMSEIGSYAAGLNMSQQERQSLLERAQQFDERTESGRLGRELQDLQNFVGEGDAVRAIDYGRLSKAVEADAKAAAGKGKAGAQEATEAAQEQSREKTRQEAQTAQSGAEATLERIAREMADEQIAAEEQAEAREAQALAQEKELDAAIMRADRQNNLDSARRTLGESGYAAFEKNYSNDVTYAQLTRAYNDGLANKKGNSSLPAGKYSAMFEAGRADAKLSLQQQTKLAKSAVSFSKAESGIDYTDADTKAYVEANVDAKTASALNTVSKALGIKVRFADSVSGGDANAEIANGVVTIEKGNPNPLRFLFGHEITHRMQELAPKEYARLRQAVSSGDWIDAKVKEIQNNHTRHGRSISSEAAMDEAVADYIGALLEDGGELERFIERNRSDRTLLEKLRDVIRDLAQKLRGTDRHDAVAEVESRLNKALGESVKQAEKNAKAQKNTATEGGVKNNMKGGKRINEASVRAALADVMDHGDAGYDNMVLLGDMPQYIQNISGINGDLYIFRNHAYENMATEEQAEADGRLAKTEKGRRNQHFHGLGEETMVQAILALEEPIITIADQGTFGNPALSMVLPVFDENGNPIHAVVNFYADEPINGVRKKRPHVAVTFYGHPYEYEDGSGRRTITDVVNDAVAGKKVLDFDNKKMRADLPVIAQDTTLGNVTAPSLAKNIAQFQKDVKSFKEKNKINYSLKTDGDTQTVTAKNGDVVAETHKNGSAKFSLKTYESDGRAYLRSWLDKKVKTKAVTREEADDIVRQMDEFYDICQKFTEKYAPFGAWSKAEVITDKNGKPVFSVVKANGEYAMNLDFSLVCKKRRTLDAVFREMINRGVMDDVELGEEQISKINAIIRESGFETACALCFVDSKRYRQASVADNFVTKYNDLVEMLIPENSSIQAHRFDFLNRGVDNRGRGLHTVPDSELGKGILKLKEVMKNEPSNKTVAYKIAWHLLNNPQDRRLVMRSEFMNTDGFEAVTLKNRKVLGLYNSSKGSGGPKAALSDVQYLGDVLKKSNFTPARAYAVGGVRIQSFSDYVARLVFDYLQMVADLAAKKLPAHAYTKEEMFALQFGMTGIKINLSLVPSVDPNGVAPGLDANGNYTWYDGQSFGSDVNVKGSGETGFRRAVEIQNAAGYSENCGTIAVGISDKHIWKMLDDNDIRMIIPYHKSSLNHIVAVMNNIDKYTDYTGVQNTRYKGSGSKINGKDFNFNDALRRLGSAKAAANEYLAWCNKNGYLPKFDAFAKHENYYKLLEDFSTYDNGVDAPQGPVKMVFPGENAAFGSMSKLIEQGLEEDAILEGRRESDVPKIVDRIEAVYREGGMESSAKLSLKGSDDLAREVLRIQKEGRSTGRSEADINADIRAAVEEVYQGMLADYGAFKPGEKPYRDVQVPRRTADDKKVSQTVRTILEAQATPDEAIPGIEQMVASGDFSYDVYTDKQAIADAEAKIRSGGWASTLADWMKRMERGEVSKELTVTGWALYNNAANIGDVDTALAVLDHMVKHQRNAAQALQATRVLKKLSPETQLYQVQKSVERLQEDLNRQYRNKKAPELKINRDLAKQYMSADTQQQRDNVMKDIYRDIGRQMPARFIDKWNAWRYLAMLGNPRTHVRNIVGNAGFAPVVAAKNLTATAIESIVSRVSGGKMQRSKSIVGLSKNDRALLSAAWKDYAAAEEATPGGKYNDAANANRYIEAGRVIFKTKALEAARRGNSAALSAEDVWFSQPHYAAALASYCKANGITAEQIAAGNNMKAARAYAITEAKKATYQDTNALSQTISDLGRVRKDEKNPVKKIVGTVMEGILPFRKTPANILARGLEYSPLGIVKGVYDATVSVKNGKKTAAEAIDALSAGLTGTGLMALGLYMAAEGLVLSMAIRGHGGGDEDENKFEEMMGHQAYALEVGGKSYTLDWLAPEALPFFIGVNLWEQTQGKADEMTLSTMLNAVKNVSEPLLEMSCLQSLNDVFDALGYASDEGLGALPTVISNAATSYITQGLPTILGQVERTGEDVRMTTYTEKNAFLTSEMQYALGKASARLPVGDLWQIPYIDAWGRTESSGGVVARAFNNFVNPSYTSKVETSDMENELLRLYEATGERSVFPSRAAKYFSVDSERKDLTGEEYVKYATKKGQTAYAVLTSLVKSSAYKNMADEDKVEAISAAYTYANAVAKAAVSDYEPEGWVAKAIQTSKNTGLKSDQYIALYLAQKSVESIKDADGETIDNSRGLIIMQMLYNTKGITQKQREALYEDFKVGKDIRGYSPALVNEKLEKMKKQAK